MSNEEIRSIVSIEFVSLGGMKPEELLDMSKRLIQQAIESKQAEFEYTKLYCRRLGGER